MTLPKPVPHHHLSRRQVLAATATSAGALAVGGSGGAAPAAASAPSDHRTRELAVTSPRGGVRLAISVADDGRALWAVSVHGQQVLAPSPLGLEFADGSDFTSGVVVADAGSARTHRETYRLRQGKASRVEVHADVRTVALRNGTGERLSLDLWASEQGAAVRYRGRSGRSTRTITAETTGLTFRVPVDGGSQFAQPYTSTAPKYQEFYIQRDAHAVAPLGATVRSQIDASSGAAFPLLVRTNDQRGGTWWALAGETNNDGTYPACHLSQPVADTADVTVTFTIAFPSDDEALGTFGPGTPQVSGHWSSPWRFVAVAPTPAQLGATTLATDLAASDRVRNESWVRPGGASFGWLTDHDSPSSLELTLPFFDLAERIGWPYSLVDSGWDKMTDASGAPVTLERLVAEGNKRGIRLFLWYNSAGTNNASTGSTPRDRLVDTATRRAEMARLHRLGIAGIKVDGWQSDKQQLMALQRDILEDAAKYKLHVVLHNTTVPRGWDRTYPHLLGYEAGIASEYYSNTKPYWDQIPEQTTIAAIARNAVGPFDYGTTLFRSAAVAGARRLTTAAHELALAVVYQSGFNGFADGPDEYLGQPAVVREFLRSIPLAWDETRFLSAEPTRELVVARRSGRTWWVAGVNGITKTIDPGLSTKAPTYKPATGQSLDLAADLRALGVGRRARITLVADTSPTDGTLSIQQLRGSSLHVPTAPFGGFVAKIVS